MPSIYIQLFIEAINVSLNKASPEKLIHLLKTNKLDWQIVRQKAYFHGINPILFDAFRQLDKTIIDTTFFEEIRAHSTQQSFFNLLSVRETVSFLTFLEGHKIQAIPFKGIVFVHELYSKKSLREGVDLDILVRREDAAKALKLLVEEGGYQLTIPEKFLKKYTTDEIIDQLLTTKGYHEVGLEKKGTQVHIDFHWEAYEDFYQYRLHTNLLFEGLTTKPFFSSSCAIPSKEAIFWMLIIHHGGRETWMRLKYFCDLLLFCQKYSSDIDWEKILEDAEKFKMKRLIIDAFYCLENQFNIQIPSPIQAQFSIAEKMTKNYSKILNFWELSQKRNASFETKTKSYNLYFALQDEGYSYTKHIKHSFLKRSYPNPLEVEERIIVFPKNYTILNFFGKLATAVSIYTGLKER